MWNCEKCSESVDATFDVCWNCGTSKDGKRDPDFVVEKEFVPKDDPGKVTLEAEISKRFCCIKCACKTPSFKRITADGAGFLDSQNNQFLVVSCKHCGFSELYNLDILGRRRGIGELLDFLFGS